jgi:hypothetical protein
MFGFQESPSRFRYYREHPIVDMRNFAQLPFASKPDAPARESGLGKSGRERISPRVILGKADSIRSRPHFPVRNTVRGHCRSTDVRCGSWSRRRMPRCVTSARSSTGRKRRCARSPRPSPLAISQARWGARSFPRRPRTSAASYPGRDTGAGSVTPAVSRLEPCRSGAAAAAPPPRRCLASGAGR